MPNFSYQDFDDGRGLPNASYKAGIKPMPETTIGPYAQAAKTHLNMLFSRCVDEYPDGLMEIRCIHPSKKSNYGGKLIKASMFKSPNFADAVSWATEMNEQGFNIYIGVNPRKPDTPPFGAASAEDVEIAFFNFADIDSQQSIDILTSDEKVPYTFAVTTGTIPNPRPHIYWELDTPARNLKAWSDTQSGIADHFQSDRVIDAPRIMRLAGMISYPDKKKAEERGYITETVTIRTEYDEDRGAISPVYLHSQFPVVKTAPQINTRKSHTEYGGSLGITMVTGSVDVDKSIDAIMNGVEWHNNMIRVVAHWMSLGRTQTEIIMMCRQFTLSGYTQEQTDAEVLQAIEGGKRKGYDLQFPSPPLTTSQVEGIISADNVKSEDREHLSTSAWLSKNIRERDYLLGSVICTTSRWMVYGQTGLGKTLFVMNIAAAMSVAANTMGWQGKRKCTVMYLDGEMPAETFKERIEQVVALYGSDAQIYGYNRDDLDDEQMPPLNTPEGEAWLWKEIAIVKPDVIVFDSIMCLLGGDMKEEDSWEPVKTMIRRLTSMRIAQIWMHHAGHNAGQAYGTSTRTWEMDTVVRLERLKEGESGFKFSFDKARLRTHENEADFVPRTACLTSDGWQTEETKQTTKKGDLRATLATRFLRELDTLTLHLTESNRRGLDGNPVKTVCIDKIKDEMKRYDVFPTDEKGQLTSNARNTLARAKQDLVDAGKIVIVDGMAWRI